MHVCEYQVQESVPPAQPTEDQRRLVEESPKANDPQSGDHSPIESAPPVEGRSSSFEVPQSVEEDSKEETVTSPSSVEDERMKQIEKVISQTSSVCVLGGLMSSWDQYVEEEYGSTALIL